MAVRRHAAVCGLLLAALGAWAAPASAAYVEARVVCVELKPCSGGGLVLYVLEGTAGEVNSVDIVESSDAVRVTDSASGVMTSDNPEAVCVREDADTAVCDKRVGSAEVSLGGGNDRLAAAEFPHPLAVGSGPGDDTVIGSAAGFNSLSGDDGNDSLTGGGEVDRLDGGPGADELRGGGGEDTASYFTSNTGVVVNLGDGGPESFGAEGDTLSEIEDVLGSRFDDVLIGDDGPNRIEGSFGADLIRGRGGGDILSGDSGIDDVDGGDGRDRVSAASDAEARDARGSCGTGFDVSEINSFSQARRSTWTVVAPDCERAAGFGISATAHPRLTRRGLWMRALCTYRCPRTGVVAVRQRGGPRRLVASGDIRATDTGRWTRVPLTRRGRKVLHRTSMVTFDLGTDLRFVTSLR